MTMTAQRFAEIVDAYGADLRRWPADERDAASEFARVHPERSRARLCEAAALDACLAADVVAPASRSLRRSILASAPSGRRSLPKPGPARWWLPGAALAGAGLAGLVAGAFAVSFLVIGAGERPSAAHEPSYLSTAFGFDFSGGEGGIE